MSEGIELTFRDGHKDLVDPVISRRVDGGELVIDNGAHEYRFAMADIAAEKRYAVEEKS